MKMTVKTLKKLIDNEFERCNNISEFKKEVFRLIDTYIEDVTTITELYAIAIKTNQVYGHGDIGAEHHICPIDGYHTDSKDFHPLFETESEAEEYKNNLKQYKNWQIVKLKINQQ